MTPPDVRTNELASVAASCVAGLVVAYARGDTLAICGELQRLLAAIGDHTAGLAGEQPEHAALLRAIQRRPT